MQILTHSSYDQIEVNLATRLIEKRRQYYKEGVIALDCGANIGVHTIEWAKNMTEWGEVFSFEPQECQARTGKARYLNAGPWPI